MRSEYSIIAGPAQRPGLYLASLYEYDANLADGQGLHRRTAYGQSIDQALRQLNAPDGASLVILPSSDSQPAPAISTTTWLEG